MARLQPVSLSDFEADDQAVLKQATVSQPKTLNEFAKSHGLRITSGYSNGGHNSGSMHYHGSEADPGAIDIDHRGVDYNQLLAWAKPNGYTVLDERTRPQGQAVWGGPHYHIQKSRNGQTPKQQAKPVKREITTAALPPVNLTMPISTDANGNIVFNQQAPTTIDLKEALKPVTQKRVKDSISLSDFELTDAERAEVSAIADQYKPAPQQSASEPVKQPGFLEGLGNAVMAIPGQMAQGLQTEYNQAITPPKDIGEALMRGVVTRNPLTQAGLGAASETANFINGLSGMVNGPKIPTGGLDELTAQSPFASTVGRALPYVAGEAGVAKLGSKFLPGVTKAIMSNPVSRTAAGAGINAAEGFVVDPGEAGMQGRLQNALLGGVAGGALHGAGELSGMAGKPVTKEITAAQYADANLPKPQTEADLIRNIGELQKQQKAQEILSILDEPSYTGPEQTGVPKYGFVGRDGQLRGTTPEPSPADLNPGKADMNVNTRELTDAFNARQKPENPAQVIDPRTREIPSELGPLKTETTPSGVIIASREAAPAREIPQIEISRGLPESRPFTKPEPKPNTTNPITGEAYDVGRSAVDSAQTFKASIEDVKAAQELRAQAESDVRARVQEIKKLGGSEDLVTAQRSLGSQIQELEAKANAGTITPDEANELAMKRASFDGLQEATRQYNEADALLRETEQPTSRSSVDTRQPQTRDILKANEPTPLRSAQEIAMERTNAPDRPAVEPVKPVTQEVQPRTREITAPEILDASGNPIRRTGEAPKLEIANRNPSTQPLEVPRPFEKPKTRDIITEAAAKPKAVEPTVPEGGIYKAPDGGEVYTHGRDTSQIQQQLEGSKAQIANIADIERHLQQYNPDGTAAIQNILNAGKNSEAVKFSYVAREAPGEAARVRDNFVPTHFTYETIKPGTQRSYLRRKFGSDDAVISHLKQEILNRGGSVSASMLQNKGGGSIKPATQISRLINTLNDQMGGAYLKSPRVHGLNLGESTRTGHVDRGIRLDTITDSSLTGRKVQPEALQKSGATYNNQIEPALKALEDLSTSSGMPVFKRAVKQVQKGEISNKTVRELKAALKDDKLAAQFCNILGIKP